MIVSGAPYDVRVAHAQQADHAGNELCRAFGFEPDENGLPRLSRDQTSIAPFAKR